jgi:hypothetical protein
MMYLICQAQHDNTEKTSGKFFLQGGCTYGTLTVDDLKYDLGYNISAGYQNHKYEGFFYECSVGISTRQYKDTSDFGKQKLFVGCIYTSPLTVGLRTERMEFTCGLYGSYDIWGSSTTQLKGLGVFETDIDDLENYNRCDCGINVSARYYVANQLFLHAGIQRGFLNISKVEGARNQCFYAFELGIGVVLP